MLVGGEANDPFLARQSRSVKNGNKGYGSRLKPAEF